jgi:hypothetical protein
LLRTACFSIFPAQYLNFETVLTEQGYDPTDGSQDPSTPVGIGNFAAALVLEWRHHDGANQLGDLLPGGSPYADYTGYMPTNTADILADPNRWQPLWQANGNPQVFLAAHWRLVAPFALQSASQFQPRPPHQYPVGSIGSKQFRCCI